MNEIPVNQAITALKETLVGKTITYEQWEEASFNDFNYSLNWLDQNFMYVLKAEAQCLKFNIIEMIDISRAN